MGLNIDDQETVEASSVNGKPRNLKTTAADGNLRKLNREPTVGMVVLRDPVGVDINGKKHRLAVMVGHSVPVGDNQGNVEKDTSVSTTTPHNIGGTQGNPDVLANMDDVTTQHVTPHITRTDTPIRTR